MNVRALYRLYRLHNSVYRALASSYRRYRCWFIRATDRTHARAHTHTDTCTSFNYLHRGGGKRREGRQSFGVVSRCETIAETRGGCSRVHVVNTVCACLAGNRFPSYRKESAHTPEIRFAIQMDRLALESA